MAEFNVCASRGRRVREGVEHYDLDRVFPARASILVEDRDPDAWC